VHCTQVNGEVNNIFKKIIPYQYVVFLIFISKLGKKMGNAKPNWKGLAQKFFKIISF
jgi:hypothetical protein